MPPGSDKLSKDRAELERSVNFVFGGELINDRLFVEMASYIKAWIARDHPDFEFTGFASPLGQPGKITVNLRSSPRVDMIDVVLTQAPKNG